MVLSLNVTKVDMCSRAMVLLGLKPVANLDGDDDKTITANTLYPLLRSELLIGHPWRWQMAKVQLARSTTAPVNEWKYAYQLPPDRIVAPRAVYDTATVGARSNTNFDVFGEFIFSNDEVVVIDYQTEVAEVAWPQFFTVLMTYGCAARFAESMTDDTSKVELWNGIAFGPPSDGGRGGYYATARRIDSARRPAEAVQDFSLIAVRG